MGKRSTEHLEILKQLGLAFSRGKRRNQGRQIYSRQLKDMAVRAIDAGLGARAVANAAGISTQSVVNWKRHLPAPRELKIVAASARSPVPARQLPVAVLETARVTLRSGAMIELPASLLTAQLIDALNGGGL